jgi:hypothetical protein
MDFASIIDGNRRAVDEQRTLACNGKDFGVAALHRITVRQHSQDYLGVTHGSGRVVAYHHALVGGGGCRGNEWVETPHRVAGGNQVGRHWSTHVT